MKNYTEIKKPMTEQNVTTSDKGSVQIKIDFKFKNLSKLLPLLTTILATCVAFTGKQNQLMNAPVDPVTVSDPPEVAIPVIATDFNSVPAVPYDDDVSGSFIDANGKVYQCTVASDGTLHVLLD